MANLGLVLNAGGARGAYQAGVLKRIGELPSLRGKPSPFPIIAGASAGAINGSVLAAGSGNIHETTQRLAQLWSSVKMSDIFRTGFLPLAVGGVRWLRDLTLGGLIGGGNAQSLLDASPLRDFLSGHIRFSDIGESIRAGHLYAVAVSATSYYSGKSFAFIQGRKGHPLWAKSRRIALSVDLNVDHICGSCAIPIVFQPVKIRSELGDFYFGDGGLRLTTPFSPAIRLGADRIFAIGIRSQRSAEERTRSELLEMDNDKPRMRRPPLAQICGVILNSIFLDHLDTDLDHLKRMNDLLQYYGADGKSPPATRTSTLLSQLREPMKMVAPYLISPSIDLATIAETFSAAMPRVLRYLMEGFGSSQAQSADLMSYLLFDGGYTRALVEIGYRDAGEEIAAIEEFLQTV